MRLPGSSAYLVAFLTERILAFLLMKVLIQDVSSEVFGLWTQLVTTSALISVILIWRLDNGLITTLANEPVGSRKSFFALSSVVFLPLTIFMWLVAHQYEVQLSVIIFGEGSYGHLLMPLILFSVSEAVLYIVYGFLRSVQKSNWMSFLYFLRFGCRSILLIVFFVEFHFSLSQALIFLSAFNLSLAIVFFIPGEFQRLRISDFLAKSKLIFRESSGQLFVVILYWVISSLDRYILLHYFDISAVAVYAFLLGIAAPIALFPSIMQQTLLPALSNLFEEDKFTFQKLSSEFFQINIFIGIGAAMGFIAVSDFLARLLGTSDFQIELGQTILVAALMFSMAIDQILGGVLTAQKRAVEHLRLCLIMTAILSCLLIILVPIFGISGALIAKFCTNIIQIAFLTKLLNYNLLLGTSYLNILRWLASGFLMILFLEAGKTFEVFDSGFLGLILSVAGGSALYLSLNLSFFLKKVIPNFLKDHKT